MLAKKCFDKIRDLNLNSFFLNERKFSKSVRNKDLFFIATDRKGKFRITVIWEAFVRSEEVLRK